MKRRLVVKIGWLIILMLAGCGKQIMEERAGLQQEIVADESALIEEKEALESERNIPTLLYNNDNLTIQEIGEVSVDVEAYTQEWKAEDCLWMAREDSFKFFDGYIYAYINFEGNWYKQQTETHYMKCNPEEILEEYGIYHDPKYQYVFRELEWQDNGCTFICNRFLKSEDKSKNILFLEEEDSSIWIHKDFNTGKETQLMISGKPHIKITETGCLYGMPFKENNEKEQYELWQYNQITCEVVLLKRFEKVQCDYDEIYRNENGDIAVVLFEKANRGESWRNCSVFCSWDDFSNRTRIEKMSSYYIAMMNNQVFLFNGASMEVTTINQKGIKKGYSWDIIGGIYITVLEDMPITLSCDKEFEPCEMGVLFRDLYGDIIYKEFIPPFWEQGIEYGMKAITVNEGIFYGLFLDESGKDGICRKLDISAKNLGMD